MHEEKFIMFRNRLAKVYKHLGKTARRMNITCFRVYDHDLPEFPLCIEFYGNRLYVAEYKRRHGMTDEEHDDWMEKTLEIVMEILGVKKEDIFLKLRQRKPGRLGQYQKLDTTQHEFVIEESDLKLIVNLSDYLDTGLFLDHRNTRGMVKDQSKDKQVLNLFAYTGSFSVYAAAGGAAQVTTVDLSRTYLNWAEKNLQLNGFDDSLKYSCIQADVKQYLKTIPAGHFDIVVMDPPTFSNSKRMEDFLDIQRDHAELVNDCLRGMKEQGQLYFSTNFRKFILEKDKIHSSSIKDITKTSTPFDFEGRLHRSCYLITK
jgi:23S rRNA (cytosine1962-C5)-methyltransferase